MNPKQITARGLTLLLVVLIAAACGPMQAERPLPTNPPVPPGATPTSMPIIPATIAQPTATVPVAEITSEPLSEPGSLLPSREVITSENAHSLELLDYLGRGQISGIAWAPDGVQMAVAASSGIYLVDTRTWEEDRLSDVSSGMVVYSPDGRMLASTEGSVVKFWDVSGKHELYSLIGHTDKVYSIAFSPDGKLIVSGSQDATIRLWDASSGEELDKQPGGGTFVYQVAFSPDGWRLTSTAYEEKIRWWEVVNGENLSLVSTYEGIGLIFSPAGDMLAITDFGSVELWNSNHSQKLSTIEESTGATPEIAFSPDGKILALGNDTSIRLWDIASQKEIRTLTVNNPSRSQLAFSPDGKRLATITSKMVKIWDVASGQELHTIRGGAETTAGGLTRQYDVYGQVPYLAFSPNGDTLAVGYGDHEAETVIKLYDMDTWKLRGELTGQSGLLAFSPDGKLLANSPGFFGAKELKIWDVETQKQILFLPGYSERVWAIEFSPDNTLLVTAEGDGYGVDGSAKVWDVRTGKLLAEFGQTHDIETEIPGFWTVWDVDFSPDGKFLVTANANGVVQFWDVAEQVETKVMKISDGMVFALDISPDGKLLATSSASETNDPQPMGFNWVPDLSLWDLSTGELLFKLPGYKENVFQIAFSPNGQVLAALDWEGLRLWGVGSGQELAFFDVSSDSNLSFSPDGTLLVTGGDVVRFWGVPSE